MSRRWRGLGTIASPQADLDPSHLDLAGSYALQLREYHAKCMENPGFAMDILQHSAASALSRSGKDMGVAESPEQLSHEESGLGITTNNSPSDPGSWRSSAPPRTETTPMHHMPHHSPHLSNRAPGTAHGPLMQQSPTSMNGYHEAMPPPSARPSISSPDGPDYLMEMSDALMGQNFAQLDRVITFDGTPFSFDPLQFGDYSFNNFDMPPNR